MKKDNYSLEKECLNYEPDKDYNGSVGHGLADGLYKKYGLYGVPNLEMVVKYGEAFEILKSTNPSKIFSSSNQRRDLKGILGRLDRDTNFEIKDYKKMNNAELWNYYMGLRGDFGLDKKKLFS